MSEFICFADALNAAVASLSAGREPGRDLVPALTYLEQAVHETGVPADVVSKGKAEVEKAWAVSESPIETLFAPFLVFQSYGPKFSRPASVVIVREKLECPYKPDDGQIVIVPQARIWRYRLDFALFARVKDRLTVVAVECDGADFHSGVEDWFRDADLLGFGIQTVRATGSEIYRSPQSISCQVGALLANWAGA